MSKEAVSPISVLGVGLDSILPLVATGSTLLLMRFTWLVWTAERDPRRRPDGELVSWLLVAAAGIVVPWLVGERWTPRADGTTITPGDVLVPVEKVLSGLARSGGRALAPLHDGTGAVARGLGVVLNRDPAHVAPTRGGDADVARVVLVAVRARRCGRGAARRGPRPGTLTSERAAAHARAGHGTRMIAHDRA